MAQFTFIDLFAGIGGSENYKPDKTGCDGFMTSDYYHRLFGKKATKGERKL